MSPTYFPRIGEDIKREETLAYLTLLEYKRRLISSVEIIPLPLLKEPVFSLKKSLWLKLKSLSRY